MALLPNIETFTQTLSRLAQSSVGECYFQAFYRCLVSAVRMKPEECILELALTRRAFEGGPLFLHGAFDVHA